MPYEHTHDDSRRPLCDARGIFLTYVCDGCEATRRLQFRADVLTDPNYRTEEPIEGDMP